jgi:hypothetical protein
MLEHRPAVEAETGTPATVNSTVITSPALPDGKSVGARLMVPTALSGKVAA